MVAGVTPCFFRSFRISLSAALRSRRFATKGLRLKPTSATLLNGLAFSLACSGKFGEAEKALRKINAEHDQKTGLVATANWGLIAFRRGDTTAGRHLYRNAIDGFHRLGLPRMERLAKAYFAREAARVGLSDTSEIIAAAERTEGPAWRESDFVMNAARELLRELTVKRAATA